MKNFMTKKIKMLGVVALFFAFCFFASNALASTFKSYSVNGSSSEWSSNELLGNVYDTGTNITTSLYTTWSSTALYFGSVSQPSCQHDLFIYISTSTSGGTTSSLDWNTSGVRHTLPINAHYAFAYDNDSVRGLYKYDANLGWISTGWNGALASTYPFGSDVHELSIPFFDLAVTTNTSLKVMAFTQLDVSNQVQHSFPSQNFGSGYPATFLKYYNFGTLSDGKIITAINVNWSIYGLSADLNSGSHSNNLTVGFTPDRDNNNDSVYFDFISAESGSYVFTIDTNRDGLYNENDFVANGNINSQSYLSPRVQWDGSKQNAGSSWSDSPKSIVDNNTTYYVQINVRDNSGNITTQEGSLGAWAVSGFATGKVVANGVPCAGASVSVGEKQSDTYYSGWSRYAIADANGNFSVYGINANNSSVYMLKATSSPYASAYSSTQTISDVYGVDFGTITLTKGVKIYGSVTNFYTGAPIESASIESSLNTMSNSIPSIWEQTNTDSSGNYLDQLNSGSHRISIRKNGFGSILTNRTLSAGTTTQLNFVLAYGGSITGKVLFGTVPVSNCNVSLYNSMSAFYDNSSINSSQANSEGSYTFSDLAAGSYIVMASPSNVRSDLGFAYHTNIDVIENRETNSTINPAVDFNLSPAVIINGSVSDTSGPLSDIEVYLMWTATQRNISNYNSTTDGSGNYSIGGVSTGTGIGIYASDKNGGHISQSSDLSFVTHAGSNTKNFILSYPNGQIAGNIINNTSLTPPFIVFAIPPGASVPKNNPDFVAMANSTGAYSIFVNTGSLYGIGIYSESEQQLLARVLNVAEGATNADLVINDGVSVSGDIKNSASGSAITSASVEILDGVSLTGFSNSDGAGNFQVKYLPVSSTFQARVNVTGYNEWTGVLYTSATNNILLVPDPNLDTQKPIISYITPALNSVISSTQPTILATLDDGDGTGINNLLSIMYVDGQNVFPSYNPNNKELSYWPFNGFGEGSHTVSLSVRDNANTPNISSVTWTFSIDISTPVISFDCYDLDGNGDRRLGADNQMYSSFEFRLQSDFSANEDGWYSLYFDMNDNGVYDEGTDYFPTSNPAVPYNIAYTSGVLTSSDWLDGYLFSKEGNYMGQIPEGVHTLVFEFTDGIHTVKSSASITVDRTNPTLQITHPSGPENVIIRNNFFDVSYLLGEDCYTISNATSVLSAITGNSTSYVLYGNQLLSGENTISFDSSMLNIFSDNSMLHLHLGAYDLAGNYSFTELNANCLVAPSTPSYFAAIASTVPLSVNILCNAPGDDGMQNMLQIGSVFALQYSQNQSVLWSTASAQTLIITTSPTNVGEGKQITISGGELSGNATYYFKLWTRDENVGCWSLPSAISSAYITLGDTVAPAAVSVGAQTSNVLGGNVKLSWNATGDDGLIGSLVSGSQFKVQYATVPSGSSHFGWDYPLAQVTTSTDSVSVGSAVSQVIGSLTSGVTYYFALWHADEWGNWSAVSNISSACASAPLPISSGTISGIMSYSGSFDGVYKVVIATSMGDNMGFITPITSFTGAGFYSFSGLPLPNTFYVMAIIDANGNGSPDGFEPVGYFRNQPDFSQSLWSAAPIYLNASSPTTATADFSFLDMGALSGRVINNSTQVGPIVVIASHTTTGQSYYNFTSNSGASPYDYSINVTTMGSYNVIAFVDVNSNRWLDSNENFAAYPISLDVTAGNNVGSVDITINDLPPSAPTNVWATAQSTGSILWSWSLSDGATYYAIYDSNDNKVRNVEGETQWLENGLSVNINYSRYVRAGNSAGLSANSASVERFTMPMTPSEASFSAVYYTSATLNWNANGNASSNTIYSVIQSTDSNFGSYSTPVPFSSNLSATSVLINTLVPGSTSYFKVIAQKPDGGVSGYSNSASAFVVVKTRKWVASSLSNSTDANAWLPVGIPQNGETIIFDGSGNGNCHWVSAVSIASMTILSPSTATITMLGDLTIDGDLDMQSGYLGANGGTITIKGDWKQTGGIVTFNAGGVSFAGTLAQKVSQTASSYFNDFSVINSSYVEANAALKINGNMYFPFGAGSFNANNNVLSLGSLSMYAGNFDAGNATHTLTGNFLVSGGVGFNSGYGTLKFIGTTNQTIYPGNAFFNNVVIDSTGTVSILGQMNLYGNFDINHGGFDTNNMQVFMRGVGNFTQKTGTTFNPRGEWTAHGIVTQTFSPLLGAFDIFSVWSSSTVQIITPAPSVQISSMYVSNNSQFDCYGSKPMSVANTLFVDGKFNLNTSTLTANGGVGAYASSTLDMGSGSIYIGNSSTISVSGVLNTYGTYNNITSTNGYFNFNITGATLNVNGLTLSGSSGVSIDTFTTVNTMYGFRNINFLNTKPGATAIAFMPANGFYIMQNCSFDTNVGINISAPNMLSSDYNAIRMDNATGAKAGFLYEYDPNNVVFWGTPTNFTTFGVSVLSSTSIVLNWSDVNNEKTYSIMSGSTEVVSGLAAGTTYFVGTGLTPNTQYIASVRARNPVGYSQSVSSTIYTLSTVPSSLTLVSKTSNTISVSWGANGNSAGTQYKVYYATTTLTTTDSSATLSGLMPYTTYYIQVTALNVPGVETSPSNQLVVRTNVVAPATPASFAGTVVSSTTIQWSWTLANSATYYIVLSTTGATMAQLDESATTWLEQGLTPNTQYTRSIKAGNITGLSAASSSASKYTYAVVPSSVSVSTVSVNSVSLTWANTSATSYRLIKNNVFLSTVAGTSYTDSGLSADTQYNYAIGAINGELAASLTTSSGTNALTLPAAPTGLVGTAASATSITWGWNIGSTNVIGYNVYTSTGFALVTGLSQATTSGVETGLLPNTQYTRVLKQYNMTGESAGTTFSKYTYATPPANINISSGSVSATSIGINWIGSGASAYRVERDNVFIATVAGTNYTDAGLSGDTIYAYRVGAINAEGLFESGAYSASASTQTKPGALSGTSAIANTTATITWKWNIGSTYSSGYNIYTSTGSLIASGLSYITTGYIETGLSANTQYTRVVKQYNASGESEGATITKYTLANAPTALSVSSATEHSLMLSWNGNNGATSPTFRVDRSQDNASWTTVLALSAGHTGTTFIDTGLALATTYYYAVFAANGDSILAIGSSTVAGFTGQLSSGLNIIITTATYEQQQSSGDVTIIIPPGAMNTTGYILINGDADTNPIEVTLSELLSAEDALSSTGRIVPGAIVELHYYDLNGTTVTGNFAQKVQLVLTYTDADNDDLVDGVTPIMRAQDLRIYRLNTATLVWEVVPGDQVLNTSAKTVSVFIEHFSIYAIVAVNSAKADLGGVKVYPNPYKPGSATIYDDTTLGSGIVFDNLTAKAKIRIYNISGELVAELSENNSDGRYIWSATNNNGSAVASGVYIYIITNTDDASQKVKGKVVVIK